MAEMSAIERLQYVANRIDELRRDADDLRNKWLRENGWKHSSQTPGCFWMWRKGEFFCDTDTAERIQRIQTADEYFDAHPEECGD
jgi:hypothetical protein